MGSVSRAARRCLPVAHGGRHMLPLGRRRIESDAPEPAEAFQRTLIVAREISR